MFSSQTSQLEKTFFLQDTWLIKIQLQIWPLKIGVVNYECPAP